MKKFFLMLVAMLLALAFAVPAMADNTPTYELGSGDKQFLMIVAVPKEGDFKINLYINTNEDTLMDALVNMGIIDVEKVSWGYNVTTVLDVTATGSSYWQITEYKNGKFVDLSTPIQQRQLHNGDVFGFILF